MSSKKSPDAPAKPKNGFSRRGFIRGVGIGSGALGSGLLQSTAVAAPAEVAKLVGPGGELVAVLGARHGTWTILRVFAPTAGP